MHEESPINRRFEATVKMSNEESTIHLEDNQKLLKPDARMNSQLYVEFNDLSYSVSQRKGKSKRILKNVSGSFRPGRLTAIIGSSGAGKTSLLTIISTLRSVNVKGSITINGMEWSGDRFRKQTCFIPQEFALLPLLTTKETLYVAARLKLDARSKSCDVNFVVNEIMESLSLTNCCNTMVQHLSGGERKRLSIGIELITKPSVLLLDEPTSGLDSASSNQVITLLHNMARAGCTVVCTVHQPSCRMISQFDDALVIEKGRTFYCGPWETILETFATCNYTCPQFYNMAEFVLEVVTGERGGDLENLRKVSMEKHLGWRTQHGHSTIGTNSSIADGDYVEERETGKLASHKLSSWQQQKVLFQRAAILIKRDKTMTKLRLITHVIVALILGTMFYESGNNASRTGSNIACMFFVLLFLYFSSSMPAVQILPTESAVFLREYLNNWYNLRSYYIVKIVSDLPLQILCPSCFIVIIYCMTGQPLECSRFFQTWLICVLMTILGQSSGILVGIAFNTEAGTFLIPALSMPMILFAGFFLKFSEMAFYLQPLSTISFFRHAFEGILLAIYGDNRRTLPCYEIYCHLSSPRQILRSLDMPTVSYKINVLMLCVWICLLQTSIYVVLKWKAYVAKK